jgi:TetR/AcrR family acrAB operon transcriptional repressor
MAETPSEGGLQPLPARIDRAERTRGRILDAAALCFAQVGFSKTTVEEIAASAGVSKGIVYHHFRGKDQILEVLLERILADWARASDLEQHIERGSGVLEAFERSLRASLEFARSAPLIRALFQLDPAVVLGLSGSSAVQRSVRDGRERMVAAVERGLATGELRAALDPERAADLLRLVSMSFIDCLLNPQWIDGGDERLVATAIDVLRRGLAAEPAR